MNPTEEGFLYIMENTLTKNLKIGISSKDPRVTKGREAQLNYGTKSDGEVRCIKVIRTPEYKKAERVLHKIFAKQRIRGEWFNIPTEETVALMLMTPTQVSRMLELWNKQAISSLKVLMGGDHLFYEGKAEYLDHIHQSNERILSEKMTELKQVQKEKAHLEKQLSVIKTAQHLKEDPRASLVRASLAALPPYGASQQEGPDE
tara:strand:- start:25 stop:633 length:609 start_codon:yes stop_codon:yes gene_type:complete